MITSYVAIGSNLDHPLQQARDAVDALGQIADTRMLACSSFYRSPPMGPQDQPDYINAVACLETNLAPLALLDALQAIESAQGRVRDAHNRWGPRTLDLDLLLYGDQVLDLTRLQVPHHGITLRPFVLWPLAEIAESLILPNGTPLQQLLAHCPKKGLERIVLSETQEK